MGRWQHLIGRSHFRDQSQAVRRLSSVLSNCDRGEIIFKASANSRILSFSRSDRSFTKRRNRKGPRTDPRGTPPGRAIVDADSERTLCEEGITQTDDFNVNAVGS